ncbi:hypothetical protein F2Q69_00045162 [Brassica cretica]|uniref:Uncharacterized protein n=1 Tax=Brassica cretica TaxID=69181 RepID=A0A8S9N6A0_BRACR|nr:hypothetical protein F2Q69_00045162 [Brassica cretica]
MRNLHFIILVLLSISTSIHYVVVTSLHVKYLPGFEGPLPFALETGYVSVGESEDVELFYYFVKSERNPKKDPLMIWLTGGPGCSSLSALLFANGPLAFKKDEYNGTLPPLELASFSWTKCISEIYVEQILLPNCPVDYVLGDIPQTLRNIKTGRRRELKEFSGNDTPSLPPPSCFVRILLFWLFSIFIGLKISDYLLSSQTYRYFLSAIWANDENVRKALGVKMELGKWNRCNIQNIPYTFDIDNAVPYHVNNSRKGGDHDMMAPYSSTEVWIRSLNYSIVDDWRPWMMSSYQVAGYTRTYANKMTFATIKALIFEPHFFIHSSPKPLQ